jgi:hypothetical protein
MLIVSDATKEGAKRKRYKKTIFYFFFVKHEQKGVLKCIGIKNSTH